MKNFAIQELLWLFIGFSTFLLPPSSFIFCLSVFVDAMRMCSRSLQSLIMLSYSAVVRSLVSLSRSSQYSVSAASFNAIVALAKNSFLLMEYWASLRFAPIDVPERNNCLASVYSFFSSHKCLYRLYILIANFRLFSRDMFIYKKYTFNQLKARKI